MKSAMNIPKIQFLLIFAIVLTSSLTISISYNKRSSLVFVSKYPITNLNKKNKEINDFLLKRVANAMVLNDKNETISSQYQVK